MSTEPTLAELRTAARKILTAFDGEHTSTVWRAVVTDTESASGFGLVCIDPEHPGIPDIGIERDEIGAYDCCPSVIETFSVSLAAYMVALLNADAEYGAELEQLRAARERTIAQMEHYRIAGAVGVHPRQVVNLLSLTWPDGNYEAAPEAADA